MKRFQNSKSCRAQEYFDNIEEQKYREECKKKQRYFTVAQYLKQYPECYTSWDPKWLEYFKNTRQVLLSGYHTAMPGDYYTCHIQRYKNDPLYYVYITDGDDWEIIKPFESKELADEEIENLKLMTPFCGLELVRYFGYKNR